MKRKDTCPICGAEVEIHQDFMDYTLMEESFECLQCGYTYEFNTGNYRVGIVFQWGYKNTPYNRAIMNAVDTAADEIRSAMTCSNEEDDN